MRVKSGINLETPLYEAVDKSSIEHIKLLLNFNADPNIPISDGMTPLHLSVIKQNVLIVKLLLKFKANPNVQCHTYKQSPVHLAIKNNVDPTILLLLVQYNGSLVLRDISDKKPIDYCNSNEMRDTLKKLRLQKEEIFKTPIKNNNEFVTPNKNNNWSISKVNNRTINSNSNKKNFDIFSTAVLQEPGVANINFIELKSNNDEIKRDLFNTTSNKYKNYNCNIALNDNNNNNNDNNDNNNNNKYNNQEFKKKLSFNHVNEEDKINEENEEESFLNKTNNNYNIQKLIIMSVMIVVFLN